jgi:hypothetical protein
VGKELSEITEITKGLEVLNKRLTKDEFRVKKVEQVTTSGAWRIYKAIPKVISKLTDGEFINGQYVDKRVEINLV